MLDVLYENIGRKIQLFAVCAFVFGALAAVVAGVALAVANNNVLYLGICVGGAIAAFSVSCFIYAFGELVDKTQKTEQHAERIKLLLSKEISRKQSRASNAPQPQPTAKTESPAAVNPSPVVTATAPASATAHRWMCDHCKTLRTQTPCEHCGTP